MKVQRRLVIAAFVVSVGLASVAPATVQAAAPPRTGWWTQAQQSAYTGNHPLPLDQTPNASDFHVSNAGCPGQPAPCADLPNTPTGGPAPVKFGPTAISAVGYALPGGELPAGTDPGTVIAQLKLTVDGAAVGSGFKLLACRILGAWLPANGGDWVERPPYQPGGCAVGAPSADGTTVAFTVVAALAGRNSVDLALVPAVGDPTPFQVLFKSADPNALTWQPLPVPPVQNNNSSSLPGPQPVGAGPASVPVASSPPGIAPTAPPDVTAPSPSAGAPAVTGGARRVGAHHVATVTHKRLVLLLLAALLAVVAVTWSRRLRRMMSSDRETVRGVGRFERARMAPARPL